MTWTEILTITAWKGTAILAAALLAALCFRRASAALRHFLWSAAFLTLLALPAALLVTPKWTPPVAFSERIVAISQGSGGFVPAPAPGRRPLLPLLWLAGCLAAAARFTIGAAWTSRWIHQARECPAAGIMARELARSLGIGRSVRVLESQAVPVPVTWGITRPVILLPAGSTAWPDGRLATVLLHELLHVRRFDLLAQGIAQAGCSVFWFHPLAWLGMREQRREREQACDDAVLRLGVPAHDYAGHIMDLVRSVSGKRRWGNAVAMADMSDLEMRVRALLDRGRNRRALNRRAAAGVLAAACAVLLPLAAVTLRAQASRGTIAGAVLDASGARVPNCRVTAKNLDGTNQETAVANAAGEYQLQAIPAGRYGVRFEAPGFAAATVEAVLVGGAALRVDGNLDLGQVHETIKVQGKRMAAAPVSRTPQRIRVGGNVTAVRLLRQTKPEYPVDLQQLGIEGSVLIRAVISTAGAVLNPVVVNTVDPRFAKAALDAVSQWQYEPARLNGQPVETGTNITVEFQLGQ